jgi:hypothetical protein
MWSKLQLEPPNIDVSNNIKSLDVLVKSTIGEMQWLDMVENEYAYLMALMRLRYEEERKIDGKIKL